MRAGITILQGALMSQKQGAEIMGLTCGNFAWIEQQAIKKMIAAAKEEAAKVDLTLYEWLYEGQEMFCGHFRISHEVRLSNGKVAPLEIQCDYELDFTNPAYIVYYQVVDSNDKVAASHTDLGKAILSMQSLCELNNMECCMQMADFYHEKFRKSIAKKRASK